MWRISRIALLVFTIAAVVVHAAASGKWRLQYFYDVAEWEFAIQDLAFPTPLGGVAVGYESDGQRVKPKSIVTRDGGKTWTDVNVKEAGLTLFFLDESIGWMVTPKGLWKTQESGLGWEKISKKRNLRRVYFRDEMRGWAVGSEKTLLETSDGGRNWTPMPVAEQIETTKDYTVFTWIEFPHRLFGSIVGYSEPPRNDASRFPDWMVPESASRRRQWPTSSIVIQTNDGGETWQRSTTSMFGRITRLRLNPTGVGLALVRFQHSFDWPAEVYRVSTKDRQTVRTYRHKNHSLTDVILAGNDAYLAGFEPLGTLAQTPVPGKVVVLHSTDLTNWTQMELDYRASGHRVILASPPDSGEVWIATDTGMILKLVSD